MVFVRGVINGTTQDVKHTFIDRSGFEIAELFVKLFGKAAFKVVNGIQAYTSQILSDFSAYTGDLLQLLSGGSGHKNTSYIIFKFIL